jgi:hypothetical protein
MPLKFRRSTLALLLATLFAFAPGAARPLAAQQAPAAPTLSGGFADFWQAHNGAVLFGQPLTGETQQDGLIVQWFERARLEWHPDYPPGQQITLGRLGAELAGGHTFPGIAPFPSNAGHRYFAATGHSIQGDILGFWQDNGGLAIFGYPLSEETVEDGRTVQYFERARLEHHPELGATGYRVLPSPLGALALQNNAGIAVVLEPPVVQEGHTTLVKVVAPAGATVTGGTFGDHALAFTCCLPFAPLGEARALPWVGAGVVSSQSPDTLPLVVTVRLPDGSSRQIARTVAVHRYPYPTNRSVYNGPRIAQATRANEHATIDAVFAGRSGPPQWSGTFVLPLHQSLNVSSPFGERRAYNNEPPYEVHEGTDLPAPTGTRVYAPAPGKVVFAQTLPLRGNCLILDHGAGVFTLYAHLSAFRATVGQTVQTGDLIALVGATGNALGPHLHWEVHASGPAVQPEEWLARSFP